MLDCFPKQAAAKISDRKYGLGGEKHPDYPSLLIDENHKLWKRVRWIRRGSVLMCATRYAELLVKAGADVRNEQAAQQLQLADAALKKSAWAYPIAHLPEELLRIVVMFL